MSIKKSTYINERLSVGLTMQQQDSVNRKLKILLNYSNDKILVSGLLMLNSSFYDYAIKCGVYSNILDCANVSKCNIFNTILNDYNEITEYRYTNLKIIKMFQQTNFKRYRVFNKFTSFYYEKSVSNVNGENNYLDLLDFAILDNNKAIDELYKYYNYNFNNFTNYHQGFAIDLYNNNYDTYLKVQKNKI